MGGGNQLLIPAPYTGVSTWAAHQRRMPPSSEPGTDYYMPIGTPLGAPSHCKIIGTGGSIGPATGRYTLVDDLEGGRWLRFLHLLDWQRGKGDVLEPGELFAHSGASGYGSEFFGASSPTDAAMIRRTGGPHVHVTAFRGRAMTFGASGTVDFHAMTGGKVAGAAAAPTIEDKDSDIMQLIGNSQDGYKLVDELGADNWAGYAFVQGGYTFGDNLAAAKVLAEQRDLSGPQLDLVRHIANERWNTKRGQIVTDVVNSLRPLFAELSAAVAGIQPERFAELIKQGLEGVVVKGAPISDADAVRIAETTIELEAKRLAD